MRRLSRSRSRAWGALVGVLLGLLLAPTPAADALPEGFTVEQVAAVPAPTAFAFLPGGGILAASQTGQLWLVDSGARRPAPVLDLGDRVCDNAERGLLGVAVDPAFPSRPFVYLYYTLNAHGSCATNAPSTQPHNRVARFRLGPGVVADPGSELVLLDEIASPNGNHNAGDLGFGKDGALYVAVGDGGRNASGSAGANDAARTPGLLLGKVLRIAPDGGIPAGNPFPDGADCALAGGAPTREQRCRETFASGFRNPFRLAFDPDAPGTRLFANDVGQNAWEEVDEVSAGGDYGWNLCEGTHDNPDRAGAQDCGGGGLTAPVFEYSHDGGCVSITGGAFVPRGVWPADYDGDYLYGDYGCGAIFRLGPDGAGPRSHLVDGPQVGSVVALAFGPADGGQALYYATHADGGALRRLRYLGDGNRAPHAAVSATPTTGSVPLDVAFDGRDSTDPEGDALTYRWDFGDGSPPTGGAEPQAVHRYARAGTYTASLVAVDARGAASAPATVRVHAGDSPPAVMLDVPPGYIAGERLVVRGTAVDPERGTLEGAALSWTVAVRHDAHTHPLVPPTPGAELVFTAPPPEDLAAVATTSLEVRFTATDAAGIATTTTAQLRPRLVEVALDTEPPGLVVHVNGTPFTGPARFPSVPCYRLQLDAPDQRGPDGTPRTFARWSDGGGRRTTLLTPAGDTRVTATFAAGGSGADGGAASASLERVAGQDRVTTAVALSGQRFPSCGAQGPLADTVVLARADGYADALSGGPLAFARAAPLLLSDSAALSPAVREEITRLGASRAVLLGGEAALSAVVADELAGLGLRVERLAGGDRFATAAAVASALPPGPAAYLVEGANADPARGWPDAVSVSWLAARSGTPILLTTRDVLPPATAQALAARGVTATTVVGGPAAVAEPLLAEVVRSGSTVTRVAGPTRYDTARALLDEAGSLEGVTAYLTTGADFPDALAAGPTVAAHGAVLLPVDGHDLAGSPATAEWLAGARGALAGVVLVGGGEAISPGVEAAVRDLLRGG